MKMPNVIYAYEPLGGDLSLPTYTTTMMDRSQVCYVRADLLASPSFVSAWLDDLKGKE